MVKSRLEIEDFISGKAVDPERYLSARRVVDHLAILKVEQARVSLV
jgi:hypothetical protein